jgi:hypothetical protein
MNKWKCTECSAIYKDGEWLDGKNPFDGEVITGCPGCKSIDSFEGVCAVADCEQVATCGLPRAEGYLVCCGEHYRQARGG